MRTRLTLELPGEQEDRYRVSSLAGDLAQARICILLLIVPVVAYAYNDYLFFGLSWPFFAVTTWRLGALIGTILLLRFLRRVKAYQSYDKAVLIWELLAALTIVGLAATRPPSYVGHVVVAVVAVFIFCLVIPGRFINQVLVSAAVLLGEAMVIVPSLHAQSRQAETVIVLTLLVAPLIALLSSWQLHTYRRKAFAAGEERLAAEEVLRESEERYRTLFNSMSEGFALHEIICDESGEPCDCRFLEINEGFERQTGLRRENVVGRTLLEVLPGNDPFWIETYGKVALTGEPVRFENYSAPLGRWYEVFAFSPVHGQFAVVFTEITERKRSESNQRLATEVLRVLNRGSGDLSSAMREILCLIKQSTGSDAVGLRMRQGDDYPYCEFDGFTDEFIEKENYLCDRREDGSMIIDAEGRVVLQCTCGLVLSGQTDPSQPFFTEGGSFWTNRSSDLLALPSEADPRTNPRNRCIHEGYQSVGLIPVRSGDEIIGLLQLNGRSEGMFTPEQVGFYEGLADNIGLALKRRQAEEALGQQSELLAAAAANTKAHLVYLDRDFNFIWVNQAYANACARTGEEFIGRNHFEFYPHQENEAIFAGVRDTGVPYEAKEKPFVFPDHPEWGVTYWDWTLTPLKDSEGTVQNLVFSLSNVTDDVLARQEIERLQAAAEELYQREHRIADILQKALIPEETCQLPGCDVAVRYQPALDEAQVGGDFYDVFELGENRAGVLIGDIAGKGLAAAMRVAAVRHAVRSYAFLDPRPGRVMTLANNALSRDAGGDAHMLTAFFAVVDTALGTVTYANGGHEAPLVRRANGAVEALEAQGQAIGIVEGYEYAEGSLRLRTDDTIVMITDGITEARPEAQMFFGIDGVRAHLLEHGHRTADEVAAGLLDAAKRHANGTLGDDAAIVVLRLVELAQGGNGE